MSTIHFDAAFGTSMFLGKGYEYVLEKEKTVISRLEWPILPVASFSIDTNVYVKDCLHLSFFSSIAIPSYSGQMFDYDYMNEKDRSILTHFSEHKSFLHNAYYFNTLIGWNQILFEYTSKKGKHFKMYLEPCAGFRYFFNNWSAVDGYTQYSKLPYINGINSFTPKVNIKGVSVSYKQSLILPNIGILTIFKLPKKLDIKLLMQLSSSIVSSCEDIHYRKNAKYNDEFEKGGFSLHFSFWVEKEFHKYFSFFTIVDYNKAISYQGSTFIYNFSSNKLLEHLNESASGTSLHFVNIGLGVRFKISK